MKRLSVIRGISAAALVLGLSSCLEIHEKVTLKKDGSGTIMEETVLGAQLSAMMQMAALQGGEGGMPDLFGEEAAKTRAEKFGKGVTVAKIEKINAEGKTGSRVTYQFADINAVTLDMSDGASSLNGMSPQAAQAAKEKGAEVKPITFTYKEGVLTIFNPQPEKEAADAAKNAVRDAIEKNENAAAEDEVQAGAEAAQMQAMAMQMMKDMKMSAKVVIEPGIAETTATHHAGDVITLMEMDMGKLMANPEVMKQLQGLDIKNPGELEKKLKAIDGVKGEEQEKVTVKLK
ncbi:MAG: hypothetical protein RI957_1450 [Verrucomicrobiota bacterium]|jgi:hypothetical protein